MTIVSQYIDSTLGRWTHTEWRPARDQILSGVVERIWDFDGMAAHPQERVFPNGLVELIVQLDDRYRDIHGDHSTLTPTVCVTGVHARPMVVQAPPRPCRVLGIRLHPAGAWAVLAHPLCELADLTADLRDVLGREAGELAEQCARSRWRNRAGAPRRRLAHPAPAPLLGRPSGSRGGLGRRPHSGERRPDFDRRAPGGDRCR